MSLEKIALFACESGKPYAEKVTRELKEIMDERYATLAKRGETEKLSADELYEQTVIEANHEELKLSPAIIRRFPGDELNVILDDTNVRDKKVFLFQNFYTTINNLSLSQNAMESFIFMNALQYAKASNISLISPYFPYGRGDKQSGKDGITAKLMAQLLETAGMNRLITLDLHADQTVGFFDQRKTKIEHVHASALLIEYIKNLRDNLKEEVSITYPDGGAVNRAGRYAKALGTDLTGAYKHRNSESEIDEMFYMGIPKHKTTVIVDDIVGSAGTMKNVINIIPKSTTNCYIACTHPLLVGNGVELLDSMYTDKSHPFQGLITTDAVPHHELIRQKPWYHEVDTSRFIAQSIYEIFMSGSMSKLHDRKQVHDLGLYINNRV
jgi:ribose-phosphate pyrophosphokinase